MTESFASHLDRCVDEAELSGVVQVLAGGEALYARARGFADRAHAIPNTLETQFALASGTKALTALTVMSLVVEGALALDADVCSVLGGATELAPPGVTVRHLLAHTSGIGDYLDESTVTDIDDYLMDVPVHRLACPADFRVVLRNRTPKGSPGAEFAYCNSGYVLLALLVEAVSGRSYYDMVEERVCAPAGMRATAFLRLDELPGSAAIGYLPSRGWRANHLHLPVRGGGDAGAYSTLGDLARLWAALFAGQVVPLAALMEMLRPGHAAAPPARSYGLGFWVAHGREAFQLEGSDAGISFRSSFEPSTGLLYSVISNTTRGAWAIVRELERWAPQIASGLGASSAPAT